MTHGDGQVFWTARPGGIALRLRLQPSASRDEITGAARLSDGSEVLAVRVRAVPEKGRANQAACRLVARAFGVAPSRVAVAAGQKDRIKTVHVAGEAEALAAEAGRFGTPSRRG